jgi:hypothetical protein
MLAAQKRRRQGSAADDEMEMIDASGAGQKPLDIGAFKTGVNREGQSLEEMFDKMEIKVVGRENEDQRS